MSTLEPLDPYSEVVDERRRWTPDWYGWITQLAKPPSGGSGTLPPGGLPDQYLMGDSTWKYKFPCVNIRDFGAVPGGPDATAAINAAYASLLGGAGTVIWPPGRYFVTDTIVVGSQSGGAGAPTSFIGTYCPGGQDQTWLDWHGPDDGRPAMLLAKNKYNKMFGLRIQNNSGTHVNNIGLQLGGAGSGAFGTQTLAMSIDNFLISGFHIGATDGNFGASSEILWIECSFDVCDTGFTLNDFNSLDHEFIDVGITGCVVGLDTGVTSGFSVFGGSCSQNEVDFNIGGNAQHTWISSMRSEESTRFVKAVNSGAKVVIESCLTTSSDAPDHISIELASASRVTIRNNELDGSISCNGSIGQITEIIGNTLHRIDTAYNSPVILPTLSAGFESRQAMAVFRNNVDAGGQPIKDFIGCWGMISNLSTGVVPYYDANILQYPVDFRDGATSISPYFSTWHTLSNVKQLSEGMIPGPGSAYTVPTPGRNLRVQGRFASSNSLAISFQRSFAVDAAIGNITPVAGTPFLQSDIGKPIFIQNGADTGADWYGTATKFNSTSSIQALGSPFGAPGGRFPQCTNKTCTIGLNEPDAAYMVLVTGNVNETFWVDSITSTGFTVHSSNATSTALVTCLIVR